jgi:hypothetical protein
MFLDGFSEWASKKVVCTLRLKDMVVIMVMGYSVGRPLFGVDIVVFDGEISLTLKNIKGLWRLIC